MFPTKSPSASTTTTTHPTRIRRSQRPCGRASVALCCVRLPLVCVGACCRFILTDAPDTPVHTTDQVLKRKEGGKYSPEKLEPSMLSIIIPYARLPNPRQQTTVNR